jgi:hypothetical protein
LLPEGGGRKRAVEDEYGAKNVYMLACMYVNAKLYLLKLFPESGEEEWRRAVKGRIQI